jgi:serine/threonine protein kinase/DNA-binding CsgD family transcriptional regulator
MLLPGTLINARYRVVQAAGQGGMGAVYQAVDMRLHVTVALKQLMIAAAGGHAFEQEARILAALRHPALPVVSDYFSENDTQFLVMQFIGGDDLAARLTQRGIPFPADQVFRWADELLDTLAYLHRQTPPVIHRDIKPHNLKLAEDGRIVLLDFGLAKGVSGMTVGASRASVFGYTPQYAPLEQIQGTGTGPASDLYSLAATLFHLLNGKPPPDALSRAAALVARRPDPLPLFDTFVPKLPSTVCRALAAALALNAADRPASAEMLREQLRPVTQQATQIGTIRSSQTTRVIEPDHRADENDEPNADLLILAAGEGAVVAVEAERRRIAELLQRSVVEPLGMLLAQANIYDQSMHAPIPTRTAVSVLSTLARQVLQQVRDLSDSLRPVVLDELGLEPALDLLAGQARRAYGVRITLDLERQRDRVPPNIEVALFRVAQEALERSAQRAQADSIHIALTRTADRLVLRIGDNGAADVGLDALEAGRRRIQQIGGSFEVGSSPWGGLEITAITQLLNIPNLTVREREVLALLAQGRNNKAIAVALSITPRTVGFHLDNIYAKLGVRSRTEAAIYAIRHL